MIIPACRGSEFFSDVQELLGHSSYVQNMFLTACNANEDLGDTPEIEIELFPVKKEINLPEQIFESLGIQFDKMVLTKHQLILFFIYNRERLLNLERYSVFLFVTKNKNSPQYVAFKKTYCEKLKTTRFDYCEDLLFKYLPIIVPRFYIPRELIIIPKTNSF